MLLTVYVCNKLEKEETKGLWFFSDFRVSINVVDIFVVTKHTLESNE